MYRCILRQTDWERRLDSQAQALGNRCRGHTRYQKKRSRGTGRVGLCHARSLWKANTGGLGGGLLREFAVGRWLHLGRHMGPEHASQRIGRSVDGSREWGPAW